MADLSEALIALSRELPPDVVVTDPEACFAASCDNARLSFLPEAVLCPRNEADIALILSLANRFRVPVTARGAGSATTGAASPEPGGWALEMAGEPWCGVRIDALSGFAHVQPGATVQAVQQAAEAAGWFYPPDPSSLKFATIGGTIATNAGGMRGAKYGVTRDYVLGLEGFLPTGEKVRWGAPLRKFVSGLNLRDLWIGSEGTLGVITGAVLKLVPLPETRHTLLAAYADESAALAAVRAMLERKINPSILEFMDRQTVTGAERMLGRPILTAAPGSALLLVEIDGTATEVAARQKDLRDWAKPSLAWEEAASADEAEALWEVRRRGSQAMFQLGDTKLNEDIVVPLESQTALLDFTLELKAATGLATPTFGHAADGNFHVHVMFNRNDPVQRLAAEKAVKAIMEKVIALGGAITGEHGIGLAKTPFLRLQHTEPEIAAMRAVKTALDPNNILNPGKIFEPFEVWKCEPVAITKPWDHR